MKKKNLCDLNFLPELKTVSKLWRNLDTNDSNSDAPFSLLTSWPSFQSGAEIWGIKRAISVNVFIKGSYYEKLTFSAHVFVHYCHATKHTKCKKWQLRCFEMGRLRPCCCVEYDCSDFAQLSTQLLLIITVTPLQPLFLKCCLAITRCAFILKTGSANEGVFALSSWKTARNFWMNQLFQTFKS